MRHEVVHQGDRVCLTTEAGRIELRFPRIQGHKAVMLVDGRNGPVEVEILPMSKRGRRKTLDFDEREKLT